MKPALLLALTLPLSAATITNVIDLPDATVVNDGTGSFQSFMWLPFSLPKYSGDPSLLIGAELTLSGHIDSGFSWLLEREDGADLFFTLAREVYIDFNNWHYASSSFSETVHVEEWGVGTLLSYPDLIDTNFSSAFSFPGGQLPLSFFAGTGTISMHVLVRNLNMKSHGLWYGTPEVTTSLSGLQASMTYVTHSPEPGTWIAGFALTGLWLRRRALRRR